MPETEHTPEPKANRLDFLDARELEARLPWPALIDALADIFSREVSEPVRHHHSITVPGEAKATLLLMPAWLERHYFGVKQVAVFPGNSLRGQPALNGSYLLSNARNGKPLLQLDADALTARRTAAASALASRYLSRPDSSRLLMMGAGRLARALIEAHQSVRPIDTLHIWSRSTESSETLVKQLQQQGLNAQRCTPEQLPEIAHQADIISCATLAQDPIIEGAWLSPGSHLDLVGAFRPDMREIDDEAVRRSHVFVDTRDGALSEAGDLLQAIENGAFERDQVVAELTDLCLGRHNGRPSLTEPQSVITLFESVGAAREDLAAAMLAYHAGTA